MRSTALEPPKFVRARKILTNTANLQFIRFGRIFLVLALWSEDTLTRLFSQLPFEPYAPVQRQFLVTLNQVNRSRKAAGLKRIVTSWLRLSRKPCKPFEKSGPLEKFPQLLDADSGFVQNLPQGSKS